MGQCAEESLYAVGYVAAGVLSELQARMRMRSVVRPVNFAHFGAAGECFRKWQTAATASSRADVYNLAGTYSASSDAKNETAAATSSTVGGRPMETPRAFMRRARQESVFLIDTGRMTTLTVMPCLGFFERDVEREALRRSLRRSETEISA